MQENNRPNRKSRVIVRAWGDEPVSLFLYRIDNTRVIVGKRNAKYTIGLPADQVFAFTEDAFSRLSKAYRENDRNKLASLYAELFIKNKPCNRYQDVLESAHDKEHIT